MRKLLIASALVLGLAAGCSGNAPSTGSSPSAATSSSASPSASAAPSPASGVAVTKIEDVCAVLSAQDFAAMNVPIQLASANVSVPGKAVQCVFRSADDAVHLLLAVDYDPDRRFYVGAKQQYGALGKPQPVSGVGTEAFYVAGKVFAAHNGQWTFTLIGQAPVSPELLAQYTALMKIAIARTQALKVS